MQQNITAMSNCYKGFKTLTLAFFPSSCGQGIDSSRTGTGSAYSSAALWSWTQASQTSNSKPDVSAKLQVSREMSNMRAFHFCAPACINQGRLGYAVTKNILVSEVYHMCFLLTLHIQGESAGGSILHTHHPSGCGRKTDTEELHVCFPQPHILLARSSNTRMSRKLGNFSTPL